MVFGKVKFKPLTVQVMGVYAQNAADLAMIGGYAVAAVTDTATGSKEFTNTNTGSVWLDAQTNGSRIRFGLFAGYTQNMGTDETW